VSLSPAREAAHDQKLSQMSQSIVTKNMTFWYRTSGFETNFAKKSRKRGSPRTRHVRRREKSERCGRQNKRRTFELPVLLEISVEIEQIFDEVGRLDPLEHLVILARQVQSDLRRTTQS